MLSREAEVFVYRSNREFSCYGKPTNCSEFWFNKPGTKRSCCSCGSYLRLKSIQLTHSLYLYLETFSAGQSRLRTSDTNC